MGWDIKRFTVYTYRHCSGRRSVKIDTAITPGSSRAVTLACCVRRKGTWLGERQQPGGHGLLRSRLRQSRVCSSQRRTLPGCLTLCRVGTE